MGTDVCYLITLYVDVDKYLVKCALKCDRNVIGWSDSFYPMEPETREKIYNLLPDNVKSFGPIVNVEQLFDITVVN